MKSVDLVHSRILIGALLFLVAACAGNQSPEQQATDTIIDKETGTFEIPDSRYRRDVEIYEHVTVLPASVMKKAESNKGGDLRFSKGVSPIDGLGEGDVILSRHDGGMARKIDKIDRTEQTVTLTLAPVHLNEVIASGEFYFGPTRRVEFDSGGVYMPPGEFGQPDKGGDWSKRQKQFQVDVESSGSPETFFQIGPRTSEQKDNPSVVHHSGSMSTMLNERLEELGLRNHLEFVHQILDLEMAASARMRFCRSDGCSGEAPESGLARMEAFDLRGHGWLDTSTRLRYSASELVVPDANANGTADWREEGLSDHRELPILSTDANADSLLSFDDPERDASIRREFEIVPGVNMRIGYELTVDLQVEAERPMDVSTGFEFTAQGGCEGSNEDSLTKWGTPGGEGSTCGRTSRHTWHTRPMHVPTEPIGDVLKLRVRIEPEITTEFTGGIKGKARQVPFAGEHRFDQHISAPEVGNCATVGETRAYGVERRELEDAVLQSDDKALGIPQTPQETRSFDRRLAFASDQVAIPGICNAAWTPVSAPNWSEQDLMCGGPKNLKNLRRTKSCPRMRREVDPYSPCHQSDSADWDDDGVPVYEDGCPCIFNPAQIDTDSAGESNPCDSDDDNDGIQDWEDNCPSVVNKAQAEGPIEGVGEACTPSTEYFCGDPPVRIKPVDKGGEQASCDFELTHLDEQRFKQGLRGFIQRDRGFGVSVGPNEGDGVSDSKGIVRFDRDGDGKQDDRFLDAQQLGFQKTGEHTAEISLPASACRAYRQSKKYQEDRGFRVGFRLVGECISGDPRYRERMRYCVHARESSDVGQDGDDWPDPAVPNPAQGYDASDSGSILRQAGTERTDASVYDHPPNTWDRCPFHDNPVPKGAETDAVASDYDPNDGSQCRVRLEQNKSFKNEQISAIEHSSPIYELEFPEDVDPDDWKGEYPLVDYSGDGILAHHPGYPQPCQPSDIRECERDEGCSVPRCSDNCPTIQNPHQADRNANGVGDRCEHQRSESVDRKKDRGELFDTNNPHYIDSTGKLKIYDSDQDDVPDHKDNCPWDWNPSQGNVNGPEDVRPAGFSKYSGRGDEKGDEVTSWYKEWHLDRRGDACDPNMDGDDIGNVCDPDIDGDGIPNILDYCRRLALQADSESGELPDSRSKRPCADSDRDGMQGQPKDYPPLGKDEISERWYKQGWAGFEDLERTSFTTSEGGTLVVGADNCPTVKNPDQLDLDHDGVGDACDPDVGRAKRCSTP